MRTGKGLAAITDEPVSENAGSIGMSGARWQCRRKIQSSLYGSPAFPNK
jgi:hypothetical protein